MSGYGGGSASKTLYAVWEKDVTYTVTYTDGVAGEEIFKDQVYSNLKSGTSTPTFSGTPERKGYTFKGWTPQVAVHSDRKCRDIRPYGKRNQRL